MGRFARLSKLDLLVCSFKQPSFNMSSASDYTADNSDEPVSPGSIIKCRNKICGEDCSTDPQILVCKGWTKANGQRVHMTERAWHYDCAETEEDSHPTYQGRDWVCLDCRFALGGFTASPARRTASTPLSNQSQQTYAVFKAEVILSYHYDREYFLREDNVLWFQVKWEQPANGTPISDTPEPFYCAEEQSPQRVFWESHNLAFPLSLVMHDRGSSLG